MTKEGGGGGLEGGGSGEGGLTGGGGITDYFLCNPFVLVMYKMCGSPKNRIEHVLICHGSATRYQSETEMQVS